MVRRHLVLLGLEQFSRYKDGYSFDIFSDAKAVESKQLCRLITRDMTAILTHVVGTNVFLATQVR